METKTKTLFKAGGMLTAFAIGIVVGIIFLANISDNIEQTIIHERSWKLVPLGQQEAEPPSGDPDATYLVIMYIYAHNTSVDPYSQNISITDPNIFEWMNVTSGEMEGETPYNTPFDIVYKVRVNATHGYEPSNNTWVTDWFYLHHQCADLGFPSLTNCTEKIISSTSEFAWVHYYNNNTGNGFTISKGQSVNVTNYEFWAYF